MFIKSPFPAMAFAVAMLLGLPSGPVQAQDADYQDTAFDDRESFSTEELDQILAPIALYPDDLLSNVLMASTYPLEVVEAARWIEEPENADLTGDALTNALVDKDWAPSVKSLTQFPDVLAQMSENLDWMRTVGDAVLADQAAVMDRIQFLRQKADEAGHLESNRRQKVVTRREDEREYIYIEPAEPDVVYVPVYEPAVYGSWWYPDYPPYYWDYDYAYVDFYYWGIGVAVAPRLWRWNSPRWNRRYIYVDARRYNRLSRHKIRRGTNRWRHHARHRRGVRYRNARLRRRHQRASIRGARAARQFNRNRLRRSPALRGAKSKPRLHTKRGNVRGYQLQGDAVRRGKAGRRGPNAGAPNAGKRKPRAAKPAPYNTIQNAPKKRGKPKSKARPGPKKQVKKGRPPGAKKRPRGKPAPAYNSIKRAPKKRGKPKAKARPAPKKQVQKGRRPGAKKKSRGKPAAAKAQKKKKSQAGPRRAKKRANVKRKPRAKASRSGGKKKVQRRGGKRKAAPKRGGGRKAAAKRGGGRKAAARRGGGGKKKGKGKGKKGKR